MSRALASVASVKCVDPIPNADRIEVVTIKGWNVVTRKGEVKPGDKVVYFEIDSFLPVEPRYEFLRQSSFKTMEYGKDKLDGFRLKTVKLRGQISQGLVLPLSVFPEIDENVEVGTDVTDLLNVKLYEIPVPANLRGRVKGSFPSHIQKTDQERIQNVTEYFTQYPRLEFEVTEKIHGTSATYFINKKGELNACSRNLNLIDDGGSSVYWQIAHEQELLDVLNVLDGEVAIQGEIYGKGVNKDPLRVGELRFAVFDMWDIKNRRYYTPEERMAAIKTIRDNGFNIEHVPIVDKNATFDGFRGLPEDTDEMILEELLLFTTNNSLINGSELREGLVFKSCSLVDGKTVSFKVLSNEVLLKES